MGGLPETPETRKMKALVGVSLSRETVVCGGYRCVRQPFSALLTKPKSLVRPLYRVISGELAKPLRRFQSKDRSR